MRTNIRLYPLVFAGILLISSCATVINGKTTRIQVYTTLPATINVAADSSPASVTTSGFWITRSKLPVTISAHTDSLQKTVIVKARNSKAFWLNAYPLFPYLLPGLLVDWKNPKRYTYPPKIYLDLTTTDSTYESVMPVPLRYRKYTHTLSVTPFKIVDLSNAVIALTVEKKLNKWFAGDVMLGYLLPGIQPSGNVQPKAQGITAGMQLKWFPYHSAPQGFYTALGVDYLTNRYYAAGSFYHSLPDSASIPRGYNYTDTFTVHKQTYTVNLMLGYEWIYKRFSIDLYWGLGVRFKNVLHTGRKFAADEWWQYHYEFIDINYTKNHAGTYSALSVPFNIRFGWTF